MEQGAVCSDSQPEAGRLGPALVLPLLEGPEASLLSGISRGEGRKCPETCGSPRLLLRPCLLQRQVCERPRATPGSGAQGHSVELPWGWACTETVHRPRHPETEDRGQRRGGERLTWNGTSRRLRVKPGPISLKKALCLLCGTLQLTQASLSYRLLPSTSSSRKPSGVLPG